MVYGAGTHAGEQMHCTLYCMHILALAMQGQLVKFMEDCCRFDEGLCRK